MPYESSPLSTPQPDRGQRSLERGRDLLAPLLREPALARRLALPDWDLAIRQARAAGLLGRLHDLFVVEGLLDAVPEAPRAHLAAAHVLALKHGRDVRWEVECIAEALAETVERVVLLKGAAYLLAGLPPARGRIFTDIDVLVPLERLSQVEVALQMGGWVFGKIDAYDNAYYRRWMHQIPPMTHVARATGVDVHHTLVPRTTRVTLDPRTLLEATRAVPGNPNVHVLAPADMILHSATHLLNEGEFGRGLRDLDDLNLLLRHFGATPGFFDELIDRAAALDLRRPLFYALRYTAEILGAPLPESVRRTDRLAPPNPVLRGLMDTLFERALRPDHPSCRDGLSGTALWLLYVRSHHLRLPAHLLVPHLVRKAYVRRFVDDA